MKQFYTVGALAGDPTPGKLHGLHGHSGPTPVVRAASAGVRPEELQAALAVANYTTPPTLATLPDRPLPLRLALLNSTAGRVLTHTTPNGGTFFAHTLLNVPAT